MDLNLKHEHNGKIKKKELILEARHSIAIEAANKLRSKLRARLFIPRSPIENYKYSPKEHTSPSKSKTLKHFETTSITRLTNNAQAAINDGAISNDVTNVTNAQTAINDRTLSNETTNVLNLKTKSLTIQEELNIPKIIVRVKSKINTKETKLKTQNINKYHKDLQNLRNSLYEQKKLFSGFKKNQDETERNELPESKKQTENVNVTPNPESPKKMINQSQESNFQETQNYDSQDRIEIQNFNLEINSANATKDNNQIRENILKSLGLDKPMNKNFLEIQYKDCKLNEKSLIENQVASNAVEKDQHIEETLKNMGLEITENTEVADYIDLTKEVGLEITENDKISVYIDLTHEEVNLQSINESTKNILKNNEELVETLKSSLQSNETDNEETTKKDVGNQEKVIEGECIDLTMEPPNIQTVESTKNILQNCENPVETFTDSLKANETENVETTDNIFGNQKGIMEVNTLQRATSNNNFQNPEGPVGIFSNSWETSETYSSKTTKTHLRPNEEIIGVENISKSTEHLKKSYENLVGTLTDSLKANETENKETTDNIFENREEIMEVDALPRATSNDNFQNAEDLIRIFPNSMETSGVHSSETTKASYRHNEEILEVEIISKSSGHLKKNLANILNTRKSIESEVISVSYVLPIDVETVAKHLNTLNNIGDNSETDISKICDTDAYSNYIYSIQPPLKEFKNIIGETMTELSKYSSPTTEDTQTFNNLNNLENSINDFSIFILQVLKNTQDIEDRANNDLKYVYGNEFKRMNYFKKSTESSTRDIVNSPPILESDQNVDPEVPKNTLVFSAPEVMKSKTVQLEVSPNSQIQETPLTDQDDFRNVSPTQKYMENPTAIVETVDLTMQNCSENNDGIESDIPKNTKLAIIPQNIKISTQTIDYRTLLVDQTSSATNQTAENYTTNNEITKADTSRYNTDHPRTVDYRTQLVDKNASATNQKPEDPATNNVETMTDTFRPNHDLTRIEEYNNHDQNTQTIDTRKLLVEQTSLKTSRVTVIVDQTMQNLRGSNDGLESDHANNNKLSRFPQNIQIPSQTIDYRTLLVDKTTSVTNQIFVNPETNNEETMADTSRSNNDLATNNEETTADTSRLNNDLPKTVEFYRHDQNIQTIDNRKRSVEHKSLQTSRCKRPQCFLHQKCKTIKWNNDEIYPDASSSRIQNSTTNSNLHTTAQPIHQTTETSEITNQPSDQGSEGIAESAHRKIESQNSCQRHQDTTSNIKLQTTIQEIHQTTEASNSTTETSNSTSETSNLQTTFQQNHQPIETSRSTQLYSNLKTKAILNCSNSEMVVNSSNHETKSQNPYNQKPQNLITYPNVQTTTQQNHQTNETSEGIGNSLNQKLESHNSFENLQSKTTISNVKISKQQQIHQPNETSRATKVHSHQRSLYPVIVCHNSSQNLHMSSSSPNVQKQIQQQINQPNETSKTTKQHSHQIPEGMGKTTISNVTTLMQQQIHQPKETSTAIKAHSHQRSLYPKTVCHNSSQAPSSPNVQNTIQQQINQPNENSMTTKLQSIKRIPKRKYDSINPKLESHSSTPRFVVPKNLNECGATQKIHQSPKTARNAEELSFKHRRRKKNEMTKNNATQELLGFSTLQNYITANAYMTSAPMQQIHQPSPNHMENRISPIAKHAASFNEIRREAGELYLHSHNQTAAIINTENYVQAQNRHDHNHIPAEITRRISEAPPNYNYNSLLESQHPSQFYQRDNIHLRPPTEFQNLPIPPQTLLNTNLRPPNSSSPTNSPQSFQSHSRDLLPPPVSPNFPPDNNTSFRPLMSIQNSAFIARHSYSPQHHFRDQIFLRPSMDYQNPQIYPPGYNSYQPAMGPQHFFQPHLSHQIPLRPIHHSPRLPSPVLPDYNPFTRPFLNHPNPAFIEHPQHLLQSFPRDRINLMPPPEHQPPPSNFNISSFPLTPPADGQIYYPGNNFTKPHFMSPNGGIILNPDFENTLTQNLIFKKSTE